MVLCTEPQKIYSPGGCHEIAFQSTFSHNGPLPKTAIDKYRNTTINTVINNNSLESCITNKAE